MRRGLNRKLVFNPILLIELRVTILTEAEFEKLIGAKWNWSERRNVSTGSRQAHSSSCQDVGFSFHHTRAQLQRKPNYVTLSLNYRVTIY